VNIVNLQHGIPDSFLQPLRHPYGAAVDQMLALFVRTVPALRLKLQQQNAGTTVRGRNTLMEFPRLRRFPFVRLQPGAITC
jgi:hypothetical protein